MPGVASWNGKWTGEGRRYAASRTVPKKRLSELNHTYYHAWKDGWRANISVRQMRKGECLGKTDGFCGYEWMIENILHRGTTYDAAPVELCPDCDGVDDEGESRSSGAESGKTMIKIPRRNWHTALPEAIKTAPREATIEVQTKDMKELAELARKRMRRSDVKIVVEAESNAWPDHIPGKFSADDCTRGKRRRILDTDDEGEPEDGPVAMFDVEHFRELTATVPCDACRHPGEDSVHVPDCYVSRRVKMSPEERHHHDAEIDDSLAMPPKVRELPAWDRCEDDGESGAIGTLDLSDPEKAPFGQEWHRGLVDEIPVTVAEVEAEEKRQVADPIPLPGSLKEPPWHLLPTAHRPPALAKDEPGADPTAAVQTPAEEPRGAADHHGPAAPAPLSETCAELAMMGLADPREAISIAAVEEHVYRWRGDDPERGPMAFRTKTKADRRVDENVQRFRRPLEVTS